MQMRPSEDTNRDTPTWFIAQLKPNGLPLAEAHLARQGFETFMPRRLSVQPVPGKPSRRALVPLFPGYLFVAFAPNQPGWQAINSTRGVARLILSNPSRPIPLPDALIEGLRTRCDTDMVLGPPPDLTLGDRIRVIAGPFADFVTTIETIPEADRVGVLIDLMGRTVRAVLPVRDVERA